MEAVLLTIDRLVDGINGEDPAGTRSYMAQLRENEVHFAAEILPGSRRSVPVFIGINSKSIRIGVIAQDNAPLGHVLCCRFIPHSLPWSKSNHWPPLLVPPVLTSALCEGTKV